MYSDLEPVEQKTVCEEDVDFFHELKTRKKLYVPDDGQTQTRDVPQRNTPGRRSHSQTTELQWGSLIYMLASFKVYETSFAYC